MDRFVNGAKVRVAGSRTNSSYTGRLGTLVSYYPNSRTKDQYWTVRFEDTKEASIYQSDLEITQTKKSMSLLKSFNNIFLKEPEKSFRKAGITGEDGTLTADGQKVFLTWLLGQSGDAFKTAVVDPILAEEKECKE